MNRLDLVMLIFSGLGLVMGTMLVAGSRPAPLTDEQRESWRSRHPLTPPPEHPPISARLLARLRVLLLTCCTLAASCGVILAFRESLHAYLHIAGAFGAALWAAAAIAIANARTRGEFMGAEPGRGGTRGNDARRWEILDLYCERLGGEIATGVASTRSDLARQARKVFRGDGDLAFLRHLRTESGSGAYRLAATQLLEDLS